MVAFGLCALAFVSVGIIAVLCTLFILALLGGEVHEINPSLGGMWPTMDWKRLGVAKFRRQR